MRWCHGIGLGLLVTACGGSPPPRAKVASKPVVVVPAPKKRPLEPDPVPTRKVAQPKDLGPVMRIGSPESSWPVLGQLLPAVGDIHEVFSVDPSALIEFFLGPAMANAIDLGKPVDFAQVGWGNHNAYVVSMALTGLARACNTLADEFTIERRNGALALEPRDKTQLPGKLGPGDACEIRAARGAAPYRLICGTRSALPRYSQWLASELAARPLPGGADLWLGVIDAHSAPDYSSPPRSAADRFGEQLGEKLVHDIDSFGMGLVVRDQSVKATLELEVDEPHSLVPTEILGQPGHATPPPPAFFRLPADTSLAVYSVGADPARVHAEAGAFWKGLSAVLAKEVAPADLPRLQAEASRLIPTGGPSLIAYGFDVAGARKVLHRALAKKSSKPAALTKAAEALQGWTMVELDEPAARWRKGILAMNAIPFGNTPTADVDKSTSSEKEVPIRPAEHLPKGSLHLHDRTFANPKYKLKPDEEPTIPYASEYYLVPDGSRTWMVWAATRRVALDKLHAALGGKPAQTLASRTDLASLGSRRGNVVGFATPAAVTALMQSGDTKSDVKLARYFLDMLSTLPRRGAEPVPFVIESSKDPHLHGKYSIRASFTVPRSNLDEIVALAMAAAAHQ